MTNQPRVAYCAPGRTAQAQALLQSRGEQYDRIEESAIMEGTFSVILVDCMLHEPDQVPFPVYQEDPELARWLREYWQWGAMIIRPQYPFPLGGV